MDILFLGDFTDVAPPQSLLDKLEAFLKFAVDIGKLNKCYHLYGERQAVENSASPGDKLFEALQLPPFKKRFKLNYTANRRCEFGCGNSNLLVIIFTQFQLFFQRCCFSFDNVCRHSIIIKENIKTFDNGS